MRPIARDASSSEMAIVATAIVVDRVDPMLRMIATGWAGALALAPVDLKGACARLSSELEILLGSAGRLSCHAYESRLEAESQLIFCRLHKPSGLWLSADPGYPGWSGPQFAELSLSVSAIADIPRAYSENWMGSMVEELIGKPFERLPLLLEAAGFNSVFGLGLHGDICGASYWSNVADAAAPAWRARREAELLDIHALGARAAGSSPSL